jgi:hypothetical protein
MQWPEHYLNHGCDPDVYVYALTSDRSDLAMRDITASEELLLDYAIDLVSGDWLEGRRASAHCRGRQPSDSFMLPSSKQMEYLPHLSCPFRRIMKGYGASSKMKCAITTDRGKEPANNRMHPTALTRGG